MGDQQQSKHIHYGSLEEKEKARLEVQWSIPQPSPVLPPPNPLLLAHPPSPQARTAEQIRVISSSMVTSFVLWLSNSILPRTRSHRCYAPFPFPPSYQANKGSNAPATGSAAIQAAVRAGNINVAEAGKTQV